MPPAPKKSTVKMSTITFDDGRVEEYDLDRPIYMLEASEILGIEQADTTNPIRLMYWLAWIAAGHPGVNGKSSTADARVAAREWLANDVRAIDIPEAPPDTSPPTKPRAGSRG